MELILIDIPGYEGLYKVSPCGTIFSTVKNVSKKPIKNWAGYMRVQLYDNNKSKIYSVHRIVAQVFIPNPNNLPEVNHIDHDRSNNKVENLEWCTRSQNAKHSFTRPDRKKARHWKDKPGKLHPNSKPLERIKEGVVIDTFESTRDAARKLSLHSVGIGRCCTGQRKSYAGYNWRYI